MRLSAGKSLSILVMGRVRDATYRQHGIDWIMMRFIGEPSPSTTIFCGFLENSPQRALTSGPFFNSFPHQRPSGESIAW